MTMASCENKNSTPSSPLVISNKNASDRSSHVQNVRGEGHENGHYESFGTNKYKSPPTENGEDVFQVKTSSPEEDAEDVSSRPSVDEKLRKKALFFGILAPVMYMAGIVPSSTLGVSRELEA